MAGIKKTTKANKSNKNVKTAKNSSREIARKEEKKAAAKKSTSTKNSSRKAARKEEKKAASTKSVFSGIFLPTARESSKFINNGIMKRHNEAQQGMFRDKPASSGSVNYNDFIKGKETYKLTPDRTAEVPVENTPRYAKYKAQRVQAQEEKAKEAASRITYKDNPLVGLGVKNSQTRMTPMQQEKYEANKKEAQSNIEYIKQHWNTLDDATKQDYALYAVYNQGINDQTKDIFDEAYNKTTGQDRLNLLSAAVYYNGYDDKVKKYVSQLSPADRQTLEKTLISSMYGEYNKENYAKGKADLTKYYDALKIQKEVQFYKDWAKKNYNETQYITDSIYQPIGEALGGIADYLSINFISASKGNTDFDSPLKGVSTDDGFVSSIMKIGRNITHDILSATNLPVSLSSKSLPKIGFTEERFAKDMGFDNVEDYRAYIDSQMKDVLDKTGWYYNQQLRRNVMGAEVSDANTEKVATVISTISNMVPAITVGLLTKNPDIATGVFGIQAGGQYARQALEEGATLEEAITYGTMGGFAEAATERLFTGFGYFGKGAVSTLAKKTGVQLLSPTTRQSLEAFGNSMGGKIVKRLAAGGGEASEEAIMELVQPFIQRATYDEEAANATWQEIAAAGGLGFVVAEILGVPATALGVYNTESGKSRFMSQFKEGLKAGGMSEEDMNAVMEQAKLVSKGKGTIASNESQIKETSVTSNLAEIATSMKDATVKMNALAKTKEVGDQVSIAVITDEGVKTLTATVRENGVTSLPTLTDSVYIKEYQDKAQRLSTAYNTAEKTGVQLNVSQNIIDSASAIEKATGTEIVFENNPKKSENGRYENGKIYVSINSENPVAQIVSHELTHTLSGTESYNSLQKLVFNYYKDSVGYKQDDVLSLYERNGYKLETEKDVNEEVMAIFVEKKLLTDFDTIKTVTGDRTLAQKIIDWLNNMIQKLTGTKEQKFFVDARNMYKKALKERIADGKQKGETIRYSTDDGSFDSKTAKYSKYGIDWKNAYDRWTNAKTPMSDYGHAMFAKSYSSDGAVNRGSKFGDTLYIYYGKGSIGFSELKKEIKNIWNEYWDENDIKISNLDYLKDYSPDQIIETFNPKNIVDDAEAYDNPEMLAWLWDNVLEPNDINAVITNDGAVVFDRDLIEKKPNITKQDAAEDVLEYTEKLKENEDIRYSISENERNPFEEELDGISAEGIFENYFKGKDGNIKYGGKKATDEVIAAMRFASELTAGIENHFSVIDNKRKISNMIKNVAMNIYLGKGFTENDVIKITKAAYENSGEKIEIEDSIKAAKKELRNLKIYIPKDVRGEVNDLGGIVALNKKGISNKTSFTFTKGNDSISLDDMRDILLNDYPGVFSDSLGVEEILQVISITPKKKMKIQGDEEALREGMTEQEMKEILENEISFVRKSLQYYSENVKNRIVNAANKEVERRYKKESKKLSQTAKKTAREFSRANKITNQRYKNISAFQAKRSEQLTEKERKIYEKAQEDAYRKKLEKRKAAVLEEAKKKNVKSTPTDTRKLLYDHNAEVQKLRGEFKKDILSNFGSMEQKNSPKYVSVLLAEKEGIDKDTFYGIYADLKGIHADKKDGKIVMGTRRKKIIDYIQSLNLTVNQKKFLYLDIAGFKLNNMPIFKNGGKVKPLGNRKGRMDRAIEEMVLDMYIGEFSSEQIDDLLSIYYGNEDVSEFVYDTMKKDISSVLLDYSEKIARAKEDARTKIMPSHGKERSTLAEMRQNAGRELKKYLLDEGEAITRMENSLKYHNLYSYYNGAKQGNAVATTMLFGKGQYNFSGEYVGRSLYEIMEPILKRGDRVLPGKEKDNSYLEAFEKYMFELHNKDRIIYSKPVTNSTLTESKEIVEDLLKQYPEFKKIGEEVHQFVRNLLDMAVSVGRISREDAVYFKEKYPHYVPTFRTEEEMDNSGKIHRVHKIFKTAEGGNKPLDPLWDQLERRTREIVKELKKNELALQFMTAYAKDPIKAQEFMEVDDLPVENLDYDSVEDAVDNFGYEVKKKDDKKGSRPFIPAYVNGEKHNIYIVDKNILYAWDRITYKREENTFEAALRNINNFKRGTLTTYNPVFTLTNGIKDLQDMFIYNLHSEKLPFYYGKSWAGIISDNTEVAKEWRRYLASGAANASIFEYDNTVGGKKKNVSKLYDHTLKHIDDVNFLVEQAPRFAVYLETKDRLTKQNKKGLNQYSKRDIEMQAMLAAADATLNFGRSGTLVKYLNTYGATFLNAGVQGMDRLVRTFRQTKDESKIKMAENIAGLVIKMAIWGIAPSLANWLLYKDDPEYEDIPDYKKMANYIFKIGDNWFMVPKGRVIAWLSSLYYIPYGYMKGEYSINEALYEEFRSFTDNIAPSNPVTSSIIAPFFQLWANKDFFGYDIVPFSLEDKSKYLQYDKDTTELSKTITKLMHDIFTDEEGNTFFFFDWSPMKMDYIIDQMTGILGDTFLPLFKDGMFDGTAEDILKRAVKRLINPLEKKFSIDTVMTNESASEYYNLKEKLNRANKDTDGNTPDKAALKYMNSRQDEISEINSQIDDIYADKGLSDKEKEDQILVLKDQLNQLYKEIYTKTIQIRDEARSSYKAGDDIDQSYAAAIKKTQGTEYYIENHGTEGEKNTWAEVKGTGMDAGIFLEAYSKMNSFESDKDENGKTINGSLKKKIVDYIQSLDIPAEQKEALYKSKNYSDETMPVFSDGGTVQSSAANVSISPLGGDFRVSSNFGYRTAPTAGASTYHQGIDLACKVGTPVVSLENGTVTKVKDGGGYGLEVEVTDKDGNVVKYAHLSAAGVSVGDTVSAGEQIAKSGNSGTSTGPHLHLGYMVDGEWVNPANYFSIDGASSGGYYNGGGYQDVITASGKSGGKRTGGSSGKRSGSTRVATKGVQSSAYNTVKNISKTLSNEGYKTHSTVGIKPSTSKQTNTAPNNRAYLPTAATAKTGAKLPTAKGSTSTIKYNQTGTSTTATSKTSRPSYWYDSILS